MFSHRLCSGIIDGVVDCQHTRLCGSLSLHWICILSRDSERSQLTAPLSKFCSAHPIRFVSCHIFQKRSNFREQIASFLNSKIYLLHKRKKKYIETYYLKCINVYNNCGSETFQCIMLFFSKDKI